MQYVSIQDYSHLLQPHISIHFIHFLAYKKDFQKHLVGCLFNFIKSLLLSEKSKSFGENFTNFAQKLTKYVANHVGRKIF